MAAVSLPGGNGSTINGLPHLFGAGCPDGALILMEIDAALLKGETAIVENSSYLCLQILDHHLILNPQDTAG